MYTEEYSDKNDYVDDNYDSTDYDQNYDDQQENKQKNFWNDNKSLIIKVIIIVLCLIILFWLVLKLKGNDKPNNGNNGNATVYTNNLNSFRLASEKYFFIDKHMPSGNESKTVTLTDLNKAGLIGNLVDGSNKACNGNSSYATLTKGEDSYVLTINLVCGLNKPEAYYYSLSNYACLNCNGATYMDGSFTPSDNDNEDNNDNNNDNTDVSKFSCTNWSSWTSQKINDTSLDVRTRILVKGVKKGAAKEKIVYGEWSAYQKDAITPNEKLEVEMSTKQEQVWVDKTSSTPVVASDTIRNVTVQTTGGGSYSYCPSGYSKDGSRCSKVLSGDLTYVQYNTYSVINKPCGGPYHATNGQVMYRNCQWKEYTDLKYGSNPGVTTYHYQELVTMDVTYYRSRTKTVETYYEESTYTDYMEEKNLPSGYTKVNGSEKKEYSYKLKVCEK